MRFRATIEFWAHDDEAAYRALDKVKEAIASATTPYPDYVKESGIAVGEIEVTDLHIISHGLPREAVEEMVDA